VSPPAIRVGGIDYLNALPLTRYLTAPGEPPLSVSDQAPSALASALRAGRLDVALAPVVEYLACEDYRVVPGICISSYGAVESIRFYYRGPIEEVRRVGLDTSSRTSALLTRLLFRERWRGAPRFLPLEPQAGLRWLEGEEAGSSGDAAGGAALGSLDALLLIGDAALRSTRPCGWEVLDLGTEWSRWTGLPFVYAFWICRREIGSPALVRRLEAAKRTGIARVDDIVRGLHLPRVGLDASQAREYLRRTIQFDLGPAQIEGLAAFFRLLERNGLIAAAPRPLSFVETGVVAASAGRRDLT
jgi:chorismate dehydratase